MKSDESEEGMRIALERIAREAEERTGFLDLGKLGLKSLPEELFGLRHLQYLNLGNGCLDEKGEWRAAASNIAVNDLGFNLALLAALPELQTLSLADIALRDLSPLSGYATLQSLDCNRTEVADLSPLSDFASLQHLVCSGTEVADLSPLSGLTALQKLRCASTYVADLSPLSGLAALQELHCSGTIIANLSPLSGLAKLQTLDCNHTRVADLSPLSGLAVLQRLECSGTEIADLSPLSGLAAMQSLDCHNIRVTDLSPLSGLVALQSLDCSQTQVTDLAPLSGLVALQSLDCSQTQVTDLAPLSGLVALQSLNCYKTQVADLSPLSGFATLQSLDCSQTQVTDLAPLSGFVSLQHLVCSGTEVADLSPLSGLTALQKLRCASTYVADLSPLSGLVELQSLDCSQTQVTDLAPLSGLVALQSLHCWGTQVADLSPLSGLANLQYLNFSGCKLERIPQGFWDKPSLENLVLYKTKLPGIPAEVLLGNNCLDSLRAHLRDLEACSATLSDVKLIVLGNGRVGKTQICRRLRGEEFDESVESTHGIIVSSAKLLQPNGEELANLHHWDFGGQDIYHGTHALFLKTRAVFLIVWATETENAETHEHDGIVFRNHPVSYWLAYVRHLSGPDSPVLVVQTRCDRPEDEARRLPVEDADIDSFSFFKFVHYSALKDRGRAALDEALREAVAWLRERQGAVSIGAGRLRVQRRLEALREADLSVAPAQRQYRTLSQEHFRELCAEAGGVSLPKHCLDYLHNSGVVFYRRGLFGERIVLDQSWALEAIYTVFHREKCYREVKRLGGRFTRSLLDVLVWREYGKAEQQLFLGMMESCGICFVHKAGDEQSGTEAEYIAPDLLPEKSEVAAELDEKWGATETCETVVYRYKLHQPGLLRSLMADIGQQAGVNGLYWKDGACVFENYTRSHALIEQESLGEWRGLIRISTQGGRAAELLGRLRKLMQQQNDRWGLQPLEDPAAAAVLREESGLEARAPGLEFVQPSKPGLEWCVSYAWSDDSPEGKAREEIVERFCEAAKKRGAGIVRDKDVLKFGDSLSQFMQRIGQGKRVLVVLSDKYLKSPNCMYELFEIWRNSRLDKEEFKRRAGIYRLPCADIIDLSKRADYAVYWVKKFRELDDKVREFGPSILGVQGFQEYKRMQDFAYHVGDILDFFKDTVHPGNFEELERYELGEWEPPGD